MTNEEAINCNKNLRMYMKLSDKYQPCKFLEENYIALDMAIKALEHEAEAVQFAKWVATEIFEDMWECNKDAFAEIACRKIAKLGIVKVKGDEWILVEPQESEDKG